MLEQRTVTINGNEYVIQRLSTSKGLEVAFAIAHIIKGFAEGVNEEFVLNFSDTKVNIGKALAGIISASDVKETPLFIRNLVIDSVVSPDISKDVELYEDRFSGNYEELADLLGEILVFNKFHDLVKKNLLKLIALLQQ